MTDEAQSKERMKIIAYDDDVHAINQRYQHFVNNDLRIVYFTPNLESTDLDLQILSIPKNLVTVIHRENILDLALKLKTPEQTGIPFPQDADLYFVDGLGYDREGTEIGEFGFVPIAEQLPKNR